MLDEAFLDDGLGSFQAYSTSGASSNGGHTVASTPGPPPAKDLPSYIHCELSPVSNKDYSYPQEEECLTLPKKENIDDLFKYYFDYIHPHIPFLDEQEFWETYFNCDSDIQRFQHITAIS